MRTHPTTPAKIFVLDSLLCDRWSLTQTLKSCSYDVIGEAANTVDTLARCRELCPDIIVLEPSWHGSEMCNPNPIDLIKRLRKNLPKTQIIVFSRHQSLPSVATAYKAGAAAYVSKDSAVEMLLDAIETVLRHQIFVMPHLVDPLARFFVAGDVDPRTMLTKQELAFFVLTALGKTRQEAARKLQITEKSAANYLSRIRKLLRCETNTKLVTIAQQYYLIGLDV